MAVPATVSLRQSLVSSDPGHQQTPATGSFLAFQGTISTVMFNFP
jgi:hypothetical protein